MTSDFIQQRHSKNPAPGFMGLFSQKRSDSLSAEDKTINDTIALLKRAQKTIEKAERVIVAQTKRIETLEDISTNDALTGLPNIKGFEQAFQRERGRLLRNLDKNSMIIFIDLENYDHIKNKFGKNSAGSCVSLVAGLLRKEISAMDSLARIKKDGFALLLSGINTSKILDRSQKLAVKINNLSLITKTQEIPVSASISLQDYSPQTEFRTLFKGELAYEHVQ